ncbi:MAG TPA: hypothetical protein VK966_08740 [Longimicrobiales bacterium]|nr:hypothetical protein [Longimicrobiales bacterium]
MRHTVALHLLTLTTLGVAGCATLRGGEEPLSLAYTMAGTATYTFQDSSGFSISAGGPGDMDIVATQEGTAALTLRGEGGRLVGTVAFPRLRAEFRNPGQGAVTADENDLEGSFGITVSRRGRVEVTDTAVLSPRLRAVTGTSSLVQPLFARVPGGIVPEGGTWTDTVRVVEETEDLRSETWRVVTSALAGDTLIDARRLVRIRTSTINQIEVRGRTGGVEILQRVSGETEGVTLWDVEAGLLHSRREAGELEGSIDLPGLGAQDLPVRGYMTRAVTLESVITPDP